MHAPQGEAWYFIGGHVVHSATELLDREQFNGLPASDPTEVFMAEWVSEIARLVAEDVDLSTIRAGGRATKEYPNKEDASWWLANGPSMVEAWVRWRDARYAEGWELLTQVNEDGELVPAIEVPFTVILGDTPVKGAIDRAFLKPDTTILVVDLKAGKQTPPGSSQTGLYGLALATTHGVQAHTGCFWMARTGEATTETSLLHYTPELVGSWYAAGRRIIEQEAFIPHVTSFCMSCGVRQYCTAQGGDPSPLLNLTSK